MYNELPSVSSFCWITAYFSVQSVTRGTDAQSTPYNPVNCGAIALHASWWCYRTVLCFSLRRNSACDRATPRQLWWCMTHSLGLCLSFVSKVIYCIGSEESVHSIKMWTPTSRSATSWPWLLTLECADTIEALPPARIHATFFRGGTARTGEKFKVNLVAARASESL